MELFTFFTPGQRAAASDDGTGSETVQALTPKSELLSTVLENVGHGIVMFDGSRRLLVWNDQYQQVLQFPDGFLQVGLSNWEMALYLAKRGDLGEGDPEKLTAERLNLLWSGDDARSEITVLDEYIYDVLFQRTDDGALVITYTDITERKRAEQALRESRDRIRLIADNLPAHISYLDTEQRFRFVNKTAQEWYARPAEEILGRTSGEIVGPKAHDQNKSYLEAALSGKEQRFELNRTYPDGITRAVEMAYVPHLDESREVQGFFALVHDITERKRAEDALKESEERFRTVIDSLPSLIFLKDTAGRYLFANKAFEKRAGLKFEDVKGKTYQEVLYSSEEVSREHLAVEREVRETREVLEKELPITRPDGTIGTGLVVKFPVFGAGGDLIAVGCSINTDITERKRAEQALQESEERFRDFAESASDWFWETDAEHRFSWFSDRVEDVTGVPAEFHIGKSRLELAADQVEQDKWRAHQETLEAQLPFREFRYLRHGHDGRLQHMSSSGVPMFDAAGNFKGYRGIGTDISAEVKAKEMAAGAHERFMAAIESVSDGFALFDADDRMVFCNSRFKELNPDLAPKLVPGISFEEMLRDNIAANRILDALGDEEAFIRRRMEQHRNPSGPLVQQRQDGQWLELREERMPEGSTFLVNTDITERKRAEEALRDSRDRIRLIADNLPAGICYLDSEQRVRFVNRTLEEWYDRPAEEILGRTLGDILGKEVQDRISSSVNATLKGKVQNYEHVVKYPDGKTRAVHVEYVPHIDEGGKGQGLFALVHDITERKRAEEALRKSEERYALAVSGTNDGLWDWNIQTDEDYFSPRWKEIVGCLPDELEPVMQTFVDLVHPDDRKRVHEAVRAHLETRAPYDLEIRLRHKSGGYVWVRSRGQAIWDEDGEPLRMAGSITDITERKCLEDEVRWREQELSEAQRVGHIGHWRLDLRKREFTEWSDEVYRIFGVDRETFVPTVENFLATIHEDDLQMSIDNRNAALAEKKPYKFEYRIVRPNGEVRAIVGEARPECDESGEMATIFGVTQDITERKAADEALRESEALFRSFIDNLPSEIFVRDTTGRFTLVNHAWERVQGLSAEQAIGKTDHDILPKDQADAYVAQNRAVLETGQVFDREVELRKGNGSLFIHTIKFPIPGADGKVTAVGGIATDITGRKRAEEALRESEARLSKAAEMAKIGHWVWDEVEDKAIYCSEELAKMYGVASGDELAAMLPSHAADLEWVHPDDRERFDQEARTARETKRGVDIEYRIVNAAGEIRHLHDIEEPVLDERGKVIRSNGTAQDITEQKRAEEQLRQSQKLEAVGQLTGGVAHDFNNLLAVILGNLEFAKEELEADSSLHLLLDPALRATKRGGELTQRLLSFSRQQALRPQTVDLKACVTGMTDMLRRTLGETIEIEPIIASGLWTCDVDPGQLESALLNLAVNARDAMPKGGKLTIETANIELDDDYAAAQGDVTPGHYVRLSVTDTGTGIPSENIERVFEPFFTTKEVGEGSGLGLSMVFGFAKQSGGHVSISSEPGCGTTVQLYLPQAEAPAQPAGRESAVGDPEAQGETVLVVEDDPDVRSLVISLLQRLGYNILEACDGAEALAALQVSSGIDLLLSDVVLPGGVSGPDLAKQVTDRYPGIKVLFMSGYPDARHRHGPMVENYQLLGKPFGKRDLARKVRAVLNG